MSTFDVCNGDADGLCAALQWQLAHPAPAILITGLKRDIALLCQVVGQAHAGDEVRVFDIAMQRNRDALLALLEQGVHVRYVDHHDAGEIPAHPLLQAHIDPASDRCTSLIVDGLLQGAHRLWALVGTYGDNLTQVADTLAARMHLPEAIRAALRELGEAINHNAYGEDECDVCIPPATLWRRMSVHADPLAFLHEDPVATQLVHLRHEDMQHAASLQPHGSSSRAVAWLLPDAPWGRRVSGSLANAKAQADPGRAHAVITPRRDGSFTVSVRAPLAAPAGADRLCRQFGGNGRARAAGIDALPPDALPRFLQALADHPWGAAIARADIPGEPLMHPRTQTPTMPTHPDPHLVQRVTAPTLANYNAQADAFWAGTRDHDVSQNIDALLSHIEGPAPFTLLDFGCGPGRDLLTLSRLGHRVIGLEGTPAFVEMARQHSGCEVWQQNFLALDLPAAFFDGIFANASLFHVPGADLPRVLGQLHDALKPRGILFSSNPIGQDEEGWANGRYGVFHDPASWCTRLQEAGFEACMQYFRPPGVPRAEQRWFAGVWRKA